MQNLEQLREVLSKPKHILITSHTNPDGDALGSSLGLYHYLKKQGHKVTIVIPTELPEFLNWMLDFDKVLVFETTQTFSTQIIKQAEVIFALDYNGLGRIEGMGSLVGESKAYKVLIDHHLDPENFTHATLSDTAASSTCQLIYEFIEMLGDSEAIDIDILNALYVGILTDTGGFHYATSARLFHVVAKMMEKGVDSNKISDLVFNSYTIKSFNLLTHCLANCLELMEDCNVGIISVSQADHRRFNIQRGDLEGIVNYVLKIRTMRCAVIITERKDIVKISMRSKGDFSVQEICSKYFNGGGHKNASGGSIQKPFKEVIQMFKDLVTTEYKNNLII